MKTLFLSLLFMLPVMVQAYDVKVDGIYYNLDKVNKTATVTKGDVNYETNELESYKGNVAIPEHVKVDGVTYVVDKVDEWAFYANRNLTAITFPNTMKTIGESAFFECSGLKQVIIPNSVEYIAEYAFHSCSGLTSVTIGSGVKDIAPYSFGYCENVTKLIYAEGCTQAVNTGLTTLTSVSIPNSVTCIADSAFYDNMSLTSITIPESVTSIGDYAFSG